jgi:hypothetical protein
MSLDISQLFSKGGKPAIDLLDYCVRSIQMDPVFIFLVQEYRFGPTAAKAIALYDVFCSPGSMGRISAEKALPPYDMRLWQTLQPLMKNWTEVQEARAAEQDRPALVRPARYLFDSVVMELEKTSSSLCKIRSQYKPDLSPMENLPKGKMTPAQRQFVEKIWEPILRPRLAAAGFWRMATIA